MQQTQEFRAEARYQRVSPQKARLVLDLIKGRRVGEALQTVAFTKMGVAPLVEKVLRSAVQNANYLSQEQGLDVDVDNLYVKQAIANDGPRMKRIRPTNRGVSMNPVDHPHGGGEGKTSGGRHPVTPWGQPTRGYKTRNNKRTDAFIVGRRSK